MPSTLELLLLSLVPVVLGAAALFLVIYLAVLAALTTHDRRKSR